MNTVTLAASIQPIHAHSLPSDEANAGSSNGNATITHIRNSIVRQEQQIRYALELVNKSTLFARTRRLNHLLRYLIEETLAGRAEELTESKIGAAVFKRDKHMYSPLLDPIVRVQMSRLRERLQQYHAALNGLDAAESQPPLRIWIPSGSYKPLFEPIATPAIHSTVCATTSPATRAKGSLSQRKLIPMSVKTPQLHSFQPLTKHASNN